MLARQDAPPMAAPLWTYELSRDEGGCQRYVRALIGSTSRDAREDAMSEEAIGTPEGEEEKGVKGETRRGRVVLFSFSIEAILFLKS